MLASAVAAFSAVAQVFFFNFICFEELHWAIAFFFYIIHSLMLLYMIHLDTIWCSKFLHTKLMFACMKANSLCVFWYSLFHVAIIIKCWNCKINHFFHWKLIKSLMLSLPLLSLPLLSLWPKKKKRKKE